MSKEKIENGSEDLETMEDKAIEESEMNNDTVSRSDDEQIQGTEDEIEMPQEDMDPVQEEIESLKQQAAENLDKALRTAAEMENLRKRTSRDIENAHKYALERFIKDLLPVVDSLELGLSASNNADDIAGLQEGMDLTLKMFIDHLNKSGVEVIEPQGDKFDPELHEAVSMTETEGAEPGVVVAVMQKGYVLNGRLIRPAMVVVSK